MALGYKGKMTAAEQARHEDMMNSHHGELLRHGASPTRTDVHSRTSVGSHTKYHGKLWTIDNGKEIHHQWYSDEGVPLHSPKVAEGMAQKKHENEANPDMHSFKNSMRRKGFSEGKIFSGALRQGERYRKEHGDE